MEAWIRQPLAGYGGVVGRTPVPLRGMVLACAVNRHLFTSSLRTVSWAGPMVENPLLSLGFPRFMQEARTHTGRTHAKMSSVWGWRNIMDGNPGKSTSRVIDRHSNSSAR